MAGTLENAGLESGGASPQELESVYQAIRTLQLEHQLGRVPDGSYEDQLDAYRLEAAEILRSQALAQDANGDSSVSGESEEAALEREILLAKGILSSDAVTQESDRPETIAGPSTYGEAPG